MTYPKELGSRSVLLSPEALTLSLSGTIPSSASALHWQFLPVTPDREAELEADLKKKKTPFKSEILIPQSNRAQALRDLYIRPSGGSRSLRRNQREDRNFTF